MKTKSNAPRRAAFLDRDGVINIDRGYVFRREDFQFVAGALEGARRLHELGFLLVVTSNQSGIGRGLYTEDEFHGLTTWMRSEFRAAGAPLAGVYFCPHHPTEARGEYRCTCKCRKPAPGMLLAAARELSIDLAASIMFGDAASDIEAARRAGVPLRVLLGTDAARTPTPANEAASGASHAFCGLDKAVRSPALRAELSTQHALGR
jgi:D-glycero-D-manno-heptose 1,7-bisphosphate phosphatase